MLGRRPRYRPIMDTRLSRLQTAASQGTLWIMVDPISTSISVLALALSGITAWMNLLRRGALRMTRPTFISFNYDKVGPNGRLIKPKVFARGLLYSTGARGCVVQNMFATLRLADSKHDFTVWGHGNTSLFRGSGLFAPPTGIAENHHFNPSDGSPEFRFSAGEYELTIFAEVVADSKPKELCSVHLSVSDDALSHPLGDEAAIWFDWDPNGKRYHAHVETRSDPIGR
jgi:hypothetical protein